MHALSASSPSPYETLRAFRKTERAQLIESLRELIEEARGRAKSHATLSKDRTRWVKLAGQLIWYKDQVLRSMSYEAIEEEVSELRDLVLKKKDGTPEQSVQRRTIRKGPVVKRVTRPLPSARERAGWSLTGKTCFNAENGKQARIEPVFGKQTSPIQIHVNSLGFSRGVPGPRKPRFNPRPAGQAQNSPVQLIILTEKKDTITTLSRHKTPRNPNQYATGNPALS